MAHGALLLPRFSRALVRLGQDVNVPGWFLGSWIHYFDSFLPFLSSLCYSIPFVSSTAGSLVPICQIELDILFQPWSRLPSLLHLIWLAVCSHLPVSFPDPTHCRFSFWCLTVLLLLSSWPPPPLLLHQSWYTSARRLGPVLSLTPLSSELIQCSCRRSDLQTHTPKPLVEIIHGCSTGIWKCRRFETTFFSFPLKATLPPAFSLHRVPKLQS